MSATTPDLAAAPGRGTAPHPHPGLVLSALWTTTMLVFAYVDIFGFFRADVLSAALDGEVAGVGFTVDQRFLLLTLAYVAVPSLMVVLSLVLPQRVVRPLTVVVASLYAVSIAVSCIGETWAYYVVGSAMEVVLLGAAVVVAVRWRRV
ncbi:DUF6326 family protein [Aquipuribacter nitratireducens]|uniref:DUF6326 family protein n=1 Tax=Aquipuribacter nitratireducens TaxID=650104 RepID=A0ABW0GR43_9MICO